MIDCYGIKENDRRSFVSSENKPTASSIDSSDSNDFFFFENPSAGMTPWTVTQYKHNAF